MLLLICLVIVSGSGLAENVTWQMANSEDSEIHYLACSEQFCLPAGYENVQPPTLEDGKPLKISFQTFSQPQKKLFKNKFKLEGTKFTTYSIN